MTGPWREPRAETEDYPGLVVHDGRGSGSITVGGSRLPLWAFACVAIRDGWAEAEAGWEPEANYGFTADKFGIFIGRLLDQRGEFARLICILADVERREESHRRRAWWEIDRQRHRVTRQLRRCLQVLEQ